MDSTTARKGHELLDDRVMMTVEKTLLFEGMLLPVSVFIRLSKGSYLTLGRKGEKAIFSDYNNFHDDGFKVYVQKNDHPLLVDYITDLSSKLVSQKNVPDKVKARLLSAATLDAIENLDNKNFSSAARLQKMSKLLVEFSETNRAFEEIMKMIQDLPNQNSKHPMACCLISLTLAEEMQITLPAALEKLALGALVHDIGLKYLPPEVANKPRHQWTPSDLSIYEQHPLKGVEVLRNLKEIPQDVLLIVAEHHELSNGNGYPKKLRDVKISPLAKIVGLADLFAELLFGTTADSRIYTVDEAVQYIEDIMGQPYNRHVFLALKKVLNRTHFSNQQTG